MVYKKDNLMINSYFYLEERWKGKKCKDVAHQVGALKGKARQYDALKLTARR
jgi:hypothetical protein|tara:strand:+ start:78 stop:233 length:156 start_codon:yes stop_codon:yes gene_type:complete